jgi:ATP-dependent helicase HrpA
VDEGDTVAVRVLGSEVEQQHAMRRGTRRLLLLNVPPPVKAIHGRLTTETRLALRHHPHSSVAALFDDCIAGAADRLIAESGGPAWDEEGFTRLYDRVRAELADAAYDVVTAVARILNVAHDLDRRVQGSTSPGLRPALAEVKAHVTAYVTAVVTAVVTAQLSGLVFPGFVSVLGAKRLPDVLRYLRAIERRLDRLPDHPQRDLDLMRSVQQVQRSYEELLAELPAGAPVPEAWRDIRWMIEELRVSYFAQPMRTANPVSEKRIYRAMDELAAI